MRWHDGFGTVYVGNHLSIPTLGGSVIFSGVNSGTPGYPNGSPGDICPDSAMLHSLTVS
jgi:hypothetical protein